MAKRKQPLRCINEHGVRYVVCNIEVVRDGVGANPEWWVRLRRADHTVFSVPMASFLNHFKVTP